MAFLDIPLPIRWEDLDGYRHVNNVSIMRLLEEARVQAFWQAPADHIALGAVNYPTALPVTGADSQVHTVVASNRVEYRRQLGYRRDGVIVRLWISKLGGASLTIDYLILTRDDPDGRDPYAAARTALVTVDASTGKPVRLDAEARDVLERYTNPPLSFRE
ncbi:acyl-CoA thioesterase [Devriesea agamarum]|uniref:acyl-CoA thioesterase n=1 Tax=Devriesea agamarum TaxID=472569 RepID=UPI00071DC263|nr:thioesterase family protein [Devriesea agamarum]